jgi:hypothetical protein
LLEELGIFQSLLYLMNAAFLLSKSCVCITYN